MSRINVAIGQRAFEKVRDRIYEILVDELANQVALSYDEDLDATVFKERSTPFSAVEMPCVNIALSRGGFDNAPILKKDGTYQFNIDVWTRSKTNMIEAGDTISMLKLQKLIGVIDYILSSWQYNTLGFEKPFISRVFVDEIAIADPKRNEDAESIMMGRLNFTVRVPENVDTLEGNLIEGYRTQVKLGLTDKGYLYSGDNIPVPPPTNPPGIVYNSDIIQIGQAPSGGFYIVTDSNVRNTDGTYNVDVLAQEPLILPNIDLTVINSNNDVLSNKTIPSVKNDTTQLDDVNNIDTDGSIVPTPMGVPFTCSAGEDATATLNGGAFITIPSGATEDIELVDQTDTPIVPDSVVGNKITVTVGGGAPIGATLMKTGQTTSYATGDDGDLEEGRASDFLTLSGNNPFGNTNRFTDELGGTTYTNNIVIDWSTYDGATVLGWYRTRYTTGGGVWDDHIDYYLTLSVASFTSGWRMPNVGEVFSVLDHSLDNRLSYAPFSINNFLWTSTTNATATSQAIFLLTQGLFSSFGKTGAGSVGSIGVRTFTVTGTTLT